MSRKHARLRARLGRAGCIPLPKAYKGSGLELYLAAKRDMGPRRARKAFGLRGTVLRA